MTAIQTDWWRRWPDIYEAETADFGRFGAQVSEKKASNGQLTLDVRWPLQNDEFVDLVVEYSSHHPYCRPRVISETYRNTLSRHVDPFSGTLCLITQDGDQWDSQQTVASLIKEQLVQILRANELRAEGTVEAAADLEEQAPDPLTAYYDHTCEPGSVIHFDGDAKRIPEQFGYSEYSVQSRQIRLEQHSFEACLERVKGPSGKVLCTMRAKWRPAGQPEKQNGPWVRLDPPRNATPEELFEMASAKLKQRAALQPAYLRQLERTWNQPFSITAIFFQDEMRYEGDRFGDAWLFVISRRKQGGKVEHSLARPQRLSDDILARAPSTRPLANRKIAVLGTGAIGSFIAIELARSGVGELVLVDSDIVEPGNSVRWPLGQSSWGFPKAVALQGHLRLNFPRTKVTSEVWKIGSTHVVLKNKSVNGFKHDLEMVRQADLVIDATASVEVACAISNLCKDAATDYLMAYATMGAAGGLVLEQPAGGPSCYVCLSEHWALGSLPGPREDPTGMMVPVGCNAPTFTGASFDLQEVSLAAIRSATAMMAEQENAKRVTRLAILNMTESDSRRHPEWKQYEVSAQCSRCHPKAA